MQVGLVAVTCYKKLFISLLVCFHMEVQTSCWILIVSCLLCVYKVCIKHQKYEGSENLNGTDLSLEIRILLHFFYNS